MLMTWLLIFSQKETRTGSGNRGKKTRGEKRTQLTNQIGEFQEILKSERTYLFSL